jgi:hypothetical protein
MLSRAYDLSKAADVRELLRAGNDVQMMLGLIFKINALHGKAGYELQNVTTRGLQEFTKLIRQRLALRDQLIFICKLRGYCIDHQMGGRVRSIYARIPKRGEPRPPGKLTRLSQKALFVFSDLYNEEAFMNLIVNDVIFGENNG